MKAFLFQTGTRIAPFDDPVGETFLGGEPLAACMQRTLRTADVQIEPVENTNDVPTGGDFLVLPDTLFLTRSCLKRFLEATRAIGRSARLALTKGHATAYAQPLQDVHEDDDSVGFDLFRLRGTEVPRGMGWADLRRFLGERSERIALDPGPEIEWLPQSRPGPPREEIALPRTTLLVADVRHWVHILWLNHQLPWIRLREHWEDRPGVKRAWKSRGRNAFRRAMRLSVAGENCDIHPTASVEGSILGNRVRLGPFASVRDSILCDGVEVSDHTKFLRCVVGQGCHTLNDSYFVGCTCYPESTLASIMMRNSVFGRRVFLTSGVMFWDEPMQAPVSVVRAGVETPTGRWILGGCAGHGCVLGTRAIFLPGRAVPNRTMIVMRPEEGVVKLPTGASAQEAHVYHHGRIVPLQEALPGLRAPELE